MRWLLFLVACWSLVSIVSCRAQDLAPRAYIITPIHSNAITLTWGFYDGGLNINGAAPVNNAKGTYNVPVFSIYHSFNFFGRSANFTASLPYAVGTFSGEVKATKPVRLPFGSTGLVGAPIRESHWRPGHGAEGVC